MRLPGGVEGKAGGAIAKARQTEHPKSRICNELAVEMAASDRQNVDQSFACMFLRIGLSHRALHGFDARRGQRLAHPQLASEDALCD
jgi:hypothetical protein